jgi:predicted small secreted protein
MKNLYKVLAIALVAALAFSMASCATTTIGGASGDHGIISGFFSPGSVTEGAQAIDSYFVILGLFDVGFGNYAAKVKEAEASGKKITSVSRNFFGIVGITNAYAK